MTDLLQLQPRHMYADSAVYFRDPFVSKHLIDDDDHDESSSGWHTRSRPSTFDRSLTPPPEMNGLSHSSKPAYYQQEHGQSYPDYMSNQQAYRASTAPYCPREVSNADFGRHGSATEPSSRTMSPNPHPRQTTLDESSSRHSHKQSEPQVNAIAPSFQIPKSVNDSGGSLSELAAQIEESVVPLHPPRQLVPDAKPTTGFRKWVTTILSTTLVAQNVVILALLFVYRLKKLNPSVRGKPGSEYRLLTVALMLGNKFLDDNTYTNKTWAEVSGINVNEVHIMEVEFLSNMKYCLFTDADDWTKWQTLLGKFAAFFERASRLQAPGQFLPNPPPASALQLPKTLPSPPSSNQASPPYAADLVQNGSAYTSSNQFHPTPAPSPHVFMPSSAPPYQNPRKRSCDDPAVEPPPKRQSSAYPDYQSPNRYTSHTPVGTHLQPVPRLTLPGLSFPYGQNSPSTQTPSNPHLQQLPPLNVPARAMAMIYPTSTTHSQVSQIAALVGPSPQPQSQHQSRNQSPYPVSASNSPTDAVPPTGSGVQISPTYFLQQRNSPYRPVHNVSTLLYPPPSAALQPQTNNIEYNQMHYQPLGKPLQQRQTGRLPYVAQNIWLDGNQPPQSMTPVQQWPWMSAYQGRALVPQQ